jgi:hypothetical protein
MFVLASLEVSTFGVLEGLGVDLASGEMHLLDDVLLEHEGVDLALEVVVSLVGRPLQHLHRHLRQHTLTM